LNANDQSLQLSLQNIQDFQLAQPLRFNLVPLCFEFHVRVCLARIQAIDLVPTDRINPERQAPIGTPVGAENSNSIRLFQSSSNVPIQLARFAYPSL